MSRFGELRVLHNANLNTDRRELSRAGHRLINARLQHYSSRELLKAVHVYVFYLRHSVARTENAFACILMQLHNASCYDVKAASCFLITLQPGGLMYADT